MARVLVIDDESNIRLMVRLGLQADGHVVQTASDGLEGLDVFGDGDDFDLVLLDQRMPGMEGLQVLREMRRRDANARIVMITAFGTIDLASEALRSGATDFLRKPFTLDVLRASVFAALQSTTSSVDSRAADESGHVAPQAPTFDTLPTFDAAAINGFRISHDESRDASARSSATRKDEVRHGFLVRGANGQARACEVLLPSHLVELVKAHADREALPDGELFWRRLCEESLANYLWQNAEVPPHGELRVDELTTGLRRWVDAIL